MFRKNFFVTLLLTALFAVGGISVFGQATTEGTVFKKNAEGADVPVEGVKVDCYRVDVNQTCRSTTTDSKGRFTFIGLPVAAKVFLAVSGTGFAPQVVPVVKLGQSVVVSLEDGDGSVPTEDEVRQAARAYATNKGELTEAQKKEIEELEKKRAEIAAKNEKAQRNNEQWQTFLKEGNDAFNAGDMDTAIEKFNAGYEVDKTFVGAAPVFLNNKATALRQRAVSVYNAAAKSKDRAQIDKAREAAAKDFGDALEAANESYRLSTNAKPTEITNQANHKKNIKNSEDSIKDVLRIMGQINLNLATYIGTEEDATRAVAAYKDTLKIIPNNPDVLSGLGLALFQSSAFKGIPAEKQESLNYLDHFMKIAPKDHKMRTAAADLIAYLTKEEKLKPQKIN
ncbi:MAG: hypothetical protein HKN25_05900 [Pyrinomonadaceae bacterium]|nr:hypothetical protein [Pyrinomonadaceae bacterium]